MSFKKLLFIGSAAIVLIVAAGYVFTDMYYRAKYDIFKEHSPLFEAVKDEAERLMSKQEGRNDTGVTILYDNGGNASVDYFDEIVNASLQSKLRELDVLSEGKLSILRYSKQDGQSLIQFLFDWESAYGKPYDIVYCESRDILVNDYDSDTTEYVLDKLKGNWYGMALK
ncbi:hypothetical protein GC101_13785 [Paenibacillus sp. LMG 31459]|jgi:hypothetical protein|uniref:Uncharacterized protein n=1 Tax=Paenibacillus phytohabitans TaxID=2654978 RepID=A0ABX1YJ96_9BACL|nr:hypothetical protein [Paenibacillus phytohabitans]NOU79943.1 hypothetical protein [Paenibacillus phytohabitans]